MSKSIPLIAAALAAGAVLAPAAALAHHAFAAEFDSSKPVVLDGVVTKVRFVNPHSWVYLDVKNRDGSVTNWGFEFGTPNSLRASGVTREVVSAGTPIRLAGYKAKNGGPFGYATTVVLPGGRQVRTGSAPDAPPPPITR
ncbi:hypothetical protein H7F51_07930 [Novosphingobium flavum]|uniref:Uncharacterized protein n=1 Tax=Novosphingobium flavum TaxID=1778672 RepID=A0A7X1FS41_9SPHN|nr:DUF6152 family protein [Novosphingobium flavum]MBC2665447.1 hypothetical protein [Novosphingobium flavum]